MNNFKKKYRYIQTYMADHTVVPGNHLGFYRLGSEDDLARSLKPVMGRVVFPHFGFSFYDDPPGRIIRKGRGDIPTLFQCRRLFSLGRDSLIKLVTAQDMFTDEGLATYRGLAFHMMVGTPDHLPNDLAGLCNPVLCPGGDPDLTSPLISVCGTPTREGDGFYETMRDNAAMYEEVFHLDTHSDTGYPDFVYLTANTLTSLELSHTTVLNIIRSGAEKLKPLLQSPLCTDRDKDRLREIFSFDAARVKHLDWNHRTYPLFGIFPGLFGFEGAVFDVATGLVSGKRKSLVRFLLLLNGIGLLSERDLRYLI